MQFLQLHLTRIILTQDAKTQRKAIASTKKLCTPDIGLVTAFADSRLPETFVNVTHEFGSARLVVVWTNIRQRSLAKRSQFHASLCDRVAAAQACKSGRLQLEQCNLSKCRPRCQKNTFGLARVSGHSINGLVTWHHWQRTGFPS